MNAQPSRLSLAGPEAAHLPGSLQAAQLRVSRAVRGSRLPLPSPHLDPDRRAVEAERLAQPVDQKPLVGEVKRRRDVREEHERRRRDAGLRRVQDAHFVPAGAGRRVRGGHRLRRTGSAPPSGRACCARRPPCRSSRAASACARRSAPRCAGSARSRGTSPAAAACRRTPSTKSGPRPFIRSHLLATMMTPRAGLVGLAGDRRVLIGRALRSQSIDQHGDVGLLDRARARRRR